MHIDDFLLNFRQTYKQAKTEEGKEDIQESTLRREFGNYPSSKLEKIWKAVRRHHKASWYPVIGQVLECMEKADVKEHSFESDTDKYCNQCLKCGCNYSLKAKLCPDCNRVSEEIVHTMVKIVKNEGFASNHVSCNEYCPMCSKFKSNRLVRGAKCRAWGKEEYEKQGFNCDSCPCKSCCNEKPKKTNLETGEILAIEGDVNFKESQSKIKKV